jgi:PAS domain S-box-containing protein
MKNRQVEAQLKKFLNKFLPESNQVDKQLALTIIIIGLILIVSGTFFFLFQIFFSLLRNHRPDPRSDFITDLFILSLGILIIIIVKAGHIKQATWLVLTSFLCFAAIQTYVNGNPSTNPSGALAMLTFVVLATVLLDKKKAFWLFLIGSGVYIILHILWIMGEIPPVIDRPPINDAIFSIIIWFIITMIISGGISNTMETLRNQAKDLHQNVVDLQQVEIILHMTQDKLRETNAQLITLFNAPVDTIMQISRDGRLLNVNQTGASQLGETVEDLIGVNMLTFLDAEVFGERIQIVKDVFSKGESITFEDTLKDRIYRNNVYPIIDPKTAEVNSVALFSKDISEQKKNEEHLTHNLLEQSILQEISTFALQVEDEDELIAYVTGLLKRNLYPDHLGVLLLDEDKQYLTVHPSYEGIPEREKKLTFELGQNVVGRVAASKSAIRISNTTKVPYYGISPGPIIFSELCVPILITDRLIGVLNAESCQPDFFSDDDERLLRTIANQLGIGIERIRLFNQEHRLRIEAEIQHDISKSLTQSWQFDDVLDRFLINLQKYFRNDSSSIFLLENKLLKMVSSHGFRNPEQLAGLTFSEEDALFQEILETKSPLVLQNTEKDSRFVTYQNQNRILSWMAVPLIDNGKVFGIICFDSQVENTFTPDMAKLAQTLVNQASAAITKASLYKQTSTRLNRLQALHNIHQIFSASVDMKLSLNQYLLVITNQLEIDAAAVLIYDPQYHTLNYAHSIGFSTQALQFTRLKMGEGHAGQAALERKIIHLDNLQEGDIHLSRSSLFLEEGFKVYYGIPLIIKGQIKGVLELFHRSHIHPDPEWDDFLTSLSTQAAIAIENIQLLSEVQKSNIELNLAYNSTLEGLAKALDLRDHQTAGHSERVAEITLRLAKKMNISESQLIHIWRGALLHDIGKLAIPDYILQKPGTLTEDEWKIMKQHPEMAGEYLGGISFLKKALDIPYCHHEKWDGSGYPRGLKGEEIPLAARLFSIVDAYDALSSKRAYREAWSIDKIKEYLLSQSGIQFDPAIVTTFLDLIKNQQTNKNPEEASKPISLSSHGF